VITCILHNTEGFCGQCFDEALAKLDVAREQQIDWQQRALSAEQKVKSLEAEVELANKRTLDVLNLEQHPQTTLRECINELRTILETLNERGEIVSDEEINVAIAEACGWKNIHFYEDNAGPGFWSGIPQISEEDVFKMNLTRLEYLRKFGTKIPDYCNDLNAMHEAEKQAGMKVIKGMRFYLYEMTDQMLAHHATARQRAEAFLKTIKQEKGK
jgi:exo-beta-1,3-glucanase (GH17 family)